MMIKRIILITALAALLGATAAEAVIPGKGMRGRKILRSCYYVANLENDKLAVYEEYGYPVHRLREYAYGEITEKWTYYADGVAFVFDQDSRLIRTDTFFPENRRERFEAFPGY